MYPPPVVILRHELPSGEWHYDWLIATAGSAGARPGGEDVRDVAAWRVEQLPWQAGGAFEAIRLPPHRRLYLRFEGDIGGGRGRVEAVWRGEGRIVTADSGSAEIEVILDGVPRRYLGRDVGEAGEERRWRFEERAAGSGG